MYVRYVQYKSTSPVVKRIVGQFFAVGGFNVQFDPAIFHGSITMRIASEQTAFFLNKWNFIFYVVGKSRGFLGVLKRDCVAMI